MLEDYDRIWNEWLTSGPEEISSRINYHLQERGPFLDLLMHYAQTTYGTDGCRILEVGCGTAVDSYLLASQFPYSWVCAVDILESSLRVAKQIGRYVSSRFINLAVIDAWRLAFASESFDIVFSHGFLEHFESQLLVLQEQLRVLKTSGFLIICVPQRYSFYTLYKHFKMARGTWKYGWETEFSLAQIRALGNRLGLNLISYDGYDFFTAILARQIQKRLTIPKGSLGNRFLNINSNKAVGKSRRLNGLIRRVRAHLAVNLVVVLSKRDVYL